MPARTKAPGNRINTFSRILCLDGSNLKQTHHLLNEGSIYDAYPAVDSGQLLSTLSKLINLSIRYWTVMSNNDANLQR